MHPYIGLDIMSGRIAVQLIRSSLPFNGGWIYYTLKSVADKFLSGAPERETIAWASLVVDRIAEPFCFGSTKRELQDLQRMLRDMLVLVCCSHDQESTLQNIEHAFEHASKAISPCLDIHRVPNWPALMHSYSKIVVQGHFLDWHLHLDRNAVRSRAVFLAHTYCCLPLQTRTLQRKKIRPGKPARQRDLTPLGDPVMLDPTEFESDFVVQMSTIKDADMMVCDSAAYVIIYESSDRDCCDVGSSTSSTHAS